MQSFKSPAMKTVACLSFFLFALIQSQDARGASNGSCNTTTTSKSYVNAPSSTPTSNLCGYTKTEPTVIDNGDNRWKWTCTAQTTSGTSATCYAGKVNCGTAADTVPSLYFPTSGLCTSGTAANTTPASSSAWTWSCTGADGSVSCTKPKEIVNGTCGTATTQLSSVAPTENLCATGTGTTPSLNITSGTWGWDCNGQNGGTSSSCTATVKADCGASNNGYFSTMPAAALCVPEESAVSILADTSDFWLWDCSVPNSIAHCSAHKLIDSVCGSAHNTVSTSQPATMNLCLGGAPSTPTVSADNKFWNWTCTGGGNPPSVSCSAQRSGECGAANGTTSLGAPTGATNLCSSGASSIPLLAGDTWGWTCTGGDNVVRNCSAYKPGVCGPAAGVSSSSSPSTADLCTESTPSTPVSSGGLWRWTCTGGGNSSIACSAPNGSGDGMTNYCQKPPFIQGGIKPNLLLMLDNSASMYDLAYSAGTFGTSSLAFCYDNTYSATQNYAGYFDTAKIYKYSLTPSANHAAPDNLSDRFIESAPLPTGCAYSTSYLCVNKSGAGTTADPYRITDFYATGNLLNWLSASKFDIQKQVLTGGKYDQANTVLSGESRGCNGRRFVKEIPGLGITFAVRGPNALEPDYVNPDTQGGLSRIEIYIGNNAQMAGDCQDAITEWTNGNFGQAKGETSSCIGATNTELSAYNQIMQDCWTIKDNIAKNQPPFGTNGNTPSFNSTQISCLGVYKDICGSESAGNCSNTGLPPSGASVPNSITSDTSGEWQCTGAATHPALSPASPYHGGGSDTTGYIGRCITAYSWQGQSLDVTWDDEEDDECTKREILHYCNSAYVAEVIDPSAGVADTAATGGIPAILMDSAVQSIGQSAGTFFVRVQPGTLPTGLIQEFGNMIRIGSMGFNQIGSASEPTVMGTSQSGTNLDGSKIFSYIGYDSLGNPSELVGNHGTGLVRSVDDLIGETWTPLAEGFYNAIGYFARASDYTDSPASRGDDLRINPGDFDSAKNPSQYRCQNNNILLISDGTSTADQENSVSALAAMYNDGDTHYGATSSGTCPQYAGSQNLDDLAWLAQNRNIKTFSTSTASTTSPTELSESIKTHVVFTGNSTTGTAECNPETLMRETAENGGTALYRAENPEQLRQSLRDAFEDIAAQAASGTAVSVLSSSEGSGANLMQALFYPKRTFSNNVEVEWTSELMNYWYYLDPFFTSANIREDTIREDADFTLLDLKQDYIATIAYDSSEEKTNAFRYHDVNGNGSDVSYIDKVPIENTAAIWRAGFNLWMTDPDDRNIYTSLTPPTLIPFTTAQSAALDDYLGKTSSTIEANKTINYVRGYDCTDASGEPGECGTTFPDLIGRNRTVSSGVCATRKSPCSSDADCPSGDTCSTAETHVWKLGDIISSTPRIMGPASLNNFNLASPFGYNDKSYKSFIKSADYQNRQLVFVGANDGMLHAFKLGKLLQKWSGKLWYQAAKQEGAVGEGGIGSEAYAFIPKNVLPYLKYLQENDYCHIYMVDGPTALTDVTINKPSTCDQPNYWDCPKVTTIIDTNDVDVAKTSWRATLVGSVGIGGATCDEATPDADRISTPLTVGTETVGWSSYFALDVTDQTTPQLLWEFSHPDLGVTNVGSTTVKVGGSDKRCAINNVACTSDSECGDTLTNGNCVNTNGRWFTILASGANGTIDSSNKEFKGTSDQTLKIFVLDHKTGTLLKTIDTGITNAFAGSLSSSALDLDKDKPSDTGNYQDDAVYIGYVQNTTNGGVVRLVINDDISPDNWTVNKVIDNIGPVTTTVANLLDRKNKKLWLYFAEGRYFHKQDDLSNQRRLYGIEEPCYDATTNTILPTCTDASSLAVLKDQTSSPTTTLTDTEKGWYVNMGAQSGTANAERVISNPTPDTLGAVYFLSFSPVSDVCSYGGTSYLWAVDYKTGSKVTFKMQGKALVQVSTGEIRELNLADALTENDGRKSVGFRGIPPTGQGLMVLSPPVPIKKFMHVQEQ